MHGDESDAAAAVAAGAAGALAKNGIAVLILDFQNEFVHPRGILHGEVVDMIKHTGMAQRLPKFIASARESGALVIHSPVVIPKDQCFEPGDWDSHSYGDLKGLFAEGTFAAEFAAGVEQREGDVVLRNRTSFDAFQGTGLRDVLAARGVGALFVGGFLTNVCVEQTVRTASEVEGLKVYALMDGCAAKTEQEHFAAIKGTLPIFATTVTCHQAAGLVLRMGRMPRNVPSSNTGMVLEPVATSTAAGHKPAMSRDFDTSQERLERTLSALKTELPKKKSRVQPGRRRKSLITERNRSKRSGSPSSKPDVQKFMTLQRTMEFFGQLKVKHVLINVVLSVAITWFVLYSCPTSWQALLTEAIDSGASGVLGGFMAFSLVFRAQSCYDRWWEGRNQWGTITGACRNLAMQAGNWFGEDHATAFLAQLALFPYACKVMLRDEDLTLCRRKSNYLEASRFDDATLGEIMRLGGPYACTGIMRHISHEALANDTCKVPPTMRSGALVCIENGLSELDQTFGGCLRIQGTGMPTSYTLFMRFFILFYFMLVSFMWAPTLRWLTPIITCSMVLMINTIIIIGDQMMQPFELQWSGLPLEKMCDGNEENLMNVSSVFDFLQNKEAGDDRLTSCLPEPQNSTHRPPSMLISSCSLGSAIYAD